MTEEEIQQTPDKKRTSTFEVNNFGCYLDKLDKQEIPDSQQSNHIKQQSPQTRVENLLNAMSGNDCCARVRESDMIDRDWEKQILSQSESESSNLILKKAIKHARNQDVEKLKV